MDAICKAALLQKAAELDEGELSLINAQALRPLGAEEVFTFRLAACDNQVDRDHERFTEEALEEMSKLYVGKPVLRDHRWANASQTARVYAAGVEQDGDVKRLVLRCYMPRTEKTADTITAMESGIIRECSVGVTVGKSVCSICGANQVETICRHFGGREYDGQVCHFDLGDVRDAYEVSLVAVPAQKEAGIIKSKRYGGAEPPRNQEKTLAKARARLAMEKIRYGGN